MFNTFIRVCSQEQRCCVSPSSSLLHHPTTQAIQRWRTYHTYHHRSSYNRVCNSNNSHHKWQRGSHEGGTESRGKQRDGKQHHYLSGNWWDRPNEIAYNNEELAISIEMIMFTWWWLTSDVTSVKNLGLEDFLWADPSTLKKNYKKIIMKYIAHI